MSSECLAKRVNHWVTDYLEESHVAEGSVKPCLDTRETKDTTTIESTSGAVIVRALPIRRQYYGQGTTIVSRGSDQEIWDKDGLRNTDTKNTQKLMTGVVYLSRRISSTIYSDQYITSLRRDRWPSTSRQNPPGRYLRYWEREPGQEPIGASL